LKYDSQRGSINRVGMSLHFHDVLEIVIGNTMQGREGGHGNSLPFIETISNAISSHTPLDVTSFNVFSEGSPEK
jgi:hypothetical protein